MILNKNLSKLIIIESLLIFISSALYSLLAVNLDDFMLHEFAQQIRLGNHLYLSIDYLVAPFSFYLLALLQAMPGYSTGIVYPISVGFLSVLTFFAVVRIAINIIKSDKSIFFILSSCFACGLLIPQIWYGNLAVLFGLVAISILTISKTKMSVYFVGICCAFALLSKQNIGAVLTLFFVLMLCGNYKLVLNFCAGFISTYVVFVCLIAILANVDPIVYLKSYIEYNFSLIQSSSTRALTFAEVIKNRILIYTDYTSPIFSYYFYYYVACFLSFAVFYYFKWLSSISVYILSLATALPFFYYFIHSNHSFLNIILCFFAIILLHELIKSPRFWIWYKSGPHICLFAGFAILISSLLKGPWGIVESCASIVIVLVGIYTIFPRKILRYLVIFVLGQFTAYNCSILYNDISNLRFNDISYYDLKGIDTFYYTSRSYDGLADTVRWLELNLKENDCFFEFPPEDPIHLIINKKMCIGAINTSKNVYPYSTDHIIKEIITKNPRFIVLKSNYRQMESNSFFRQDEIEYFVKQVYKKYKKVYKNDYYIILDRISEN